MGALFIRREKEGSVTKAYLEDIILFSYWLDQLWRKQNSFMNNYVWLEYRNVF